MRKFLIALAVLFPIGGVVFSVIHKAEQKPPVVVTEPKDVWYPAPVEIPPAPPVTTEQPVKPAKPKAHKVYKPVKFPDPPPIDQPLTPPKTAVVPMVKCLFTGMPVQLCVPIY